MNAIASVPRHLSPSVPGPVPIARQIEHRVLDDAPAVSLVVVADGAPQGRAAWLPAAWLPGPPAVAA